jgi:ArsR family transcriptional regulator, arsenate/arsenite/antimonite-responsive transcriptional repressor
MKSDRSNARCCDPGERPDLETDLTLAAVFKALADPTRVAIIRQLARDGEVCACDLDACCAVAQPTVSHHLKVLRGAGLVSYDRRGQSLSYRCKRDTIDRLFALAHESLGIRVPDVTTGGMQ